MARTKILLVEDEGIVAKDIADTLKSQGYDVPAIASSGEQAIEKAEQIQPDLVLMDIVLKGDMDGIAAAEQIRRRFDIPVVYLTAYTDDKTVQRAKITEPFAYITKPFETRELCTNIEMALYKHKAEYALRESKEQFKNIFNNTLVGLYRTTPDGRILMANPAVVRMLGYESFDQLVSRNLEEEGFEAGYSRSDFKKRIEAEGRIVGLESAWKRRDGSTLFVVENAKAIRDDNGNTLCYEGTVEDITERKRAERLLQRERDNAQKYLDVAGVMLVAIDSEQRVGLINKKGCEILGYSEEQILAKNWFDNFLPERIRDEVRTVLERLVAGEPDAPEYYENPILTKNGDERLIAWHNTILRDENGEIIAALSSGEDITERKKAEDELRASEQRFKAIFENAAVGVYRTTPDGRILMANPALVRMLGYSSFEELAQRDLEKEGYERPYLRPVFSQRIEKESQVVGLESAWVRKDGTTLFLIENSRLVRDEHGNTLYYEGTAEDITERKRAEKAVLEYQGKLRSLVSELSLAEERERRRIADGIHGDIGNKLAMAKFDLQSLKKGPPDSEIPALLERVSATMDKVIEDAHSLTFELSNPVIYEVGLDAAIESWLDRNIGKKSRLKYEVVSEPSPMKPDEETRVVLFRVIRELLTNVIKHADANMVEVHIKKDDEAIRVSIEDDGVGFDLSKPGLPVKEAGGFGLFNSRERVEYVGGSFEIESEPGQGALIKISVPVQKPTSH